MDLEGKLNAQENKCAGIEGQDTAKDFAELLTVWKQRQRLWEPLYRLFFFVPYYAKSYGPRLIDGPALLVFDKHNFSSDPVFVAKQAGFRTALAKEDTSLLSRVAMYFGGIVVPDGKTREAMGRLKGQLHFHLSQGHNVAVFPFADVSAKDIKYGIVRTVMKWESGTGIPVKYVAAAVSYSNVLPFFDVWHMPKRLSKWPWPFVTRAKIYFSDSFQFSDGLFPNSVGAKELVDGLMTESASLPERYRQRRILSALYTRARQFFSG